MTRLRLRFFSLLSASHGTAGFFESSGSRPLIFHISFPGTVIRSPFKISPRVSSHSMADLGPLLSNLAGQLSYINSINSIALIAN